jgi:hypothetical protein
VPLTIFFNSALRLEERQLPEIAAVQIEQVERDEHDLRPGALEFVLQHREIGRAIGGWNYDLAVEDRRRCLDVPGVVGNLLEAMRPVVAAPGEYLDSFVGPVDLNPVSVELDLMDPARSGRHLRYKQAT